MDSFCKHSRAPRKGRPDRVAQDPDDGRQDRAVLLGAGRGRERRGGAARGQPGPRRDLPGGRRLRLDRQAGLHERREQLGTDLQHLQSDRPPPALLRRLEGRVRQAPERQQRRRQHGAAH